MTWPGFLTQVPSKLHKMVKYTNGLEINGHGRKAKTQEVVLQR